jgi:periodic tryptophan protein 1
MGAFSNIKGLTYYGDSKDDPFVTMEAVGCFCNR